MALKIAVAATCLLLAIAATVLGLHLWRGVAADIPVHTTIKDLRTNALKMDGRVVSVQAYVMSESPSDPRLLLVDEPREYWDASAWQHGLRGLVSPQYRDTGPPPMEDISARIEPRPAGYQLGDIVEAEGRYDATSNTIRASAIKKVGKADPAKLSPF